MVAGELALNTVDEKLYFKNSAGTVKLLASNAATTPTAPAGSNTQVQYNNAGAFGASSNFVWDNTNTRLGIATSSPTQDLSIGGLGATPSTFKSISFQSGATELNYVRSVVQDGNNYALTFGTYATGLAERMRITAAGNLVIGATTASNKLEVNGSARFYTAANGDVSITHSGLVSSITAAGSVSLAFGTNNTEKMRLDTSGNMLMGTTSTLGYPGLVFNMKSSGSYIGLNASSTEARVFATWDATAVPMTFYMGGVERARITTAGGFSVGTTSDPGVGAIYATGNITAFFSDKRLKTVSGKIENALDKVAQLSGVYYTFNDTAKSFGYDSDEEQVGVIAQEVEAVLPQIVKAAPFDLDENNNSKSGENYKTVQYDKLVPLLIEAINELQAKVKALETK